jgi:hypothetical protein
VRSNVKHQKVITSDANESCGRNQRRWMENVRRMRVGNNKFYFTMKKENISFLTEIFIFAVTELNMNMIRVFEGKRDVKRKSHIKKKILISSVLI